MNSTRRAWTALGSGILTLVVLAGCAQAVNGRATAADVAQSSTTSSSSSSSTTESSTSSSSSTSTTSSTTETKGGTRTNSTRSSSTETSTSAPDVDDPNVAPKSIDLLWSYRSFSSDWTSVTDDKGIHEYQWKQSQCYLGLYQPGGYMKRSTLPTDADVVAEYVDYVGKKFTDPAFTTVDTNGRDFATDVDGTPDGEVPATITLAGQHVTFAADGGEAQLYGYRNADYAIIVALYCMGGEFPATLPEMAPKLDDLAVGLYY